MINHLMKDQTLEHMDLQEEQEDQEGLESLEDKVNLVLQEGQDSLEFQDHLDHQDHNLISSHFWNKFKHPKVVKKDHHLIHFHTCRPKLDQ